MHGQVLSCHGVRSALGENTVITSVTLQQISGVSVLYVAQLSEATGHFHSVRPLQIIIPHSSDPSTEQHQHFFALKCETQSVYAETRPTRCCPGAKSRVLTFVAPIHGGVYMLAIGASCSARKPHTDPVAGCNGIRANGDRTRRASEYDIYIRCVTPLSGSYFERASTDEDTGFMNVLALR